MLGLRGDCSPVGNMEFFRNDRHTYRKAVLGCGQAGVWGTMITECLVCSLYTGKTRERQLILGVWSRGLWSCGLPEQGKCRSLACCSPGAGQCYTASQLRPRGALAIPLALRPSHGCAHIKSAVTPGLHSRLGSPSRTHFVIPYLFHIVTVNVMSTPLRFFSVE